MLTINSPALLRDIVKLKNRLQSLNRDIEINIDLWTMNKIQYANEYRQNLAEQIRLLELQLHNLAFE